MAEILKSDAKGWQPFTPRGAAALARSGVVRLLIIQFLVADLVAASVVWFLSRNCVPVVQSAIVNLPDDGRIESGRLSVLPGSAQCLAEGAFLGIVLDPDHAGRLRPPSQVVAEFGREDVRIFSLFGYMQFRYPDRGVIPFNRTELQPWWGAWSPPLLWISAGAIVLGSLLIWTVLACAYAVPVRLVSFFANRDLNWRQSWKTSGAALMPGAVILAVGVCMFGLHLLDLVQFLALFSAHVLVGWVYAAALPYWAPRIAPEAPAGNPFHESAV